MTTAEVATPSQAPAAPVPADATPRVPRWWALVLAVVAGGALLVAFPRYGLWWCAPVGVALLALAVRGRGFWAGTGLGLLGGLVFQVPLLWWTHIVGGVAPWLILAFGVAAYIGLSTGVAAWCTPLVDRYPWLWPPLVGVLWVAAEAGYGRWPFGGFPWPRLAFSQADSPLLHYAALGGAPFVTFLVAVAGGLLAWAVWRLRQAPRLAAVLTGAAVVVVLGGLLVPATTPEGPAVTVAIVQGNVPRLGLEFNAQRRAVLDNHVDATLRLADRVRTGAVSQPDLVVWPENASDIDPLVPEDADARARINQAALAIRAPILVGTLLYGPGDHLRNVSLVWDPGTGPGDSYVKRHPVPFAEYMPVRSLARLISDKVDLVRNDFVAGDRPGVLTVGPARVGVAICFEVAYDGIVRDTVTAGAQLLAVQTNNADFDTAEAGQQLAMVRLRAVEQGRDAMMVSTVGISAFVDAHGRTSDVSAFNTQAVAVRQVRLGSGRTVANAIGPMVEDMLVGLGVLALAGAAITRRQRRQRIEEE